VASHVRCYVERHGEYTCNHFDTISCKKNEEVRRCGDLQNIQQRHDYLVQQTAYLEEKMRENQPALMSLIRLKTLGIDEFRIAEIEKYNWSKDVIDALIYLQSMNVKPEEIVHVCKKYRYYTEQQKKATPSVVLAQIDSWVLTVTGTSLS
jgi:hypothetical protein